MTKEVVFLPTGLAAQPARPVPELRHRPLEYARGHGVQPFWIEPASGRGLREPGLDQRAFFGTGSRVFPATGSGGRGASAVLGYAAASAIPRIVAPTPSPALR